MRQEENVRTQLKTDHSKVKVLNIQGETNVLRITNVIFIFDLGQVAIFNE